MTEETEKPRRSAKKKATKKKPSKKKTTKKKEFKQEIKSKKDGGGTLAERRAKIRDRYEKPVVIYATDKPADFAWIRFLTLARLLGGGLKKGAIVEVAGWEDAGKAESVDMPVLTPRGWKKIGDVRVGDEVIGADGKPTEVLGVYPQGVKDVYRVETSDGGSVECCDEHLWHTRTMLERERNLSGRVRSLAEVKETLTRGTNPNHSIPLNGPVEFADPMCPDDLPLHPWLLGALIGDGQLSSGNVVLHNPEQDVIERFIDLLPEGDHGVVFETGSCKAVRVTRASSGGGPSTTRQCVDDLGLTQTSERKSIPSEYLMATPQSRRYLLRGLMDTDGTVDKPGQPSVSYSTSSPVLAENVAFLVRSLGGIARTTSRIPTYTYRGEKHEGLRAYRVSAQFPDGWCPVSSAKHRGRWSKPELVKHRSIVAIHDAGPKECVCIRVAAPDGLYVTRDFIVTHNTSLAIALAADIQARAPEGKNHVVMVNYEMAEDRVWWSVLGLRCDDEHFSMFRPRTLEEGQADAADLLQSGEVCCVIVDSVYAAASRGSAQVMEHWQDPKKGIGAGGGIGVEARQWGAAWTAMKGMFVEHDAICIAVNQVRLKLDMGGGKKPSYGPPPTTTPRGSALKFYAWVRLELTGRTLLDDKNKRRTDVDGKSVRVRVVKNKTSGDQRGMASYDLIRGQGFDLTAELIELAKEAGAIKQKGGWYYVGKGTKINGASKLREWVESDPRRREVLAQVAKRHLSKVDDDELFEDVDLGPEWSEQAQQDNDE